MEVHEGNDITIEDFISEHMEGESEIAQFYSSSKVFLTGATGFMGQLILEKLLRASRNSEVYIMLRGKKGKTLEERFKDLFESPVFERLKSERSRSEGNNFLLRVHPIEGDCSQPMLGLSSETRERIIDCNVIIHAAATVRFDEKMRLATAINVQATVDMIKLAREMKNLKAFVHISTAYSNPDNTMIEEKFYEPDITYERLINIVQNMSDEMLESITPQLITKWPNTYAFTKAVGENALKDLAGDLPVVMVRPSIVISTAREPIAGWINNVYGPTGVVAGAGIGLLHILYADKDKKADMVPADMAVNAILAAGWDIAATRAAMENSEINANDADLQVPVMNYVSSIDQPITWGQFMKYNEKGVEIPSMKCVWYYDFGLTKNYFTYLYYIALLHLLPALLVDTGCRLLGKKPFLWDAYRKIHKFSRVISFFCLRDWEFRNDNVKSVWKRMSPMDQKLFDFDVKSLSWEQYFRTYMRGLRVYLVNDPLDTLPKARKRYQKMWMVHIALKWSLRVLIFWALLQFLKQLTF